jgi:predicted outer membrane protein
VQDHHHAMARRRTSATTAAALAAAVLAACGVSIGIGPDDDPPHVSLAAAPQEAAPGERIGLVAAASDDYVVREVLFFRVDAGGDTLIASDRSEPYAVETALPTGAGATVRYFARAVDDAGQEADSREVEVNVR